jgi:hypothetical protein
MGIYDCKSNKRLKAVSKVFSINFEKCSLRGCEGNFSACMRCKSTT